MAGVQTDVGLAQVDTLTQWSSEWSLAALDGSVGCGEVGFLLMRASRLMRQILNNEALAPAIEDTLPKAIVALDAKADEGESEGAPAPDFEVEDEGLRAG